MRKENNRKFLFSFCPAKQKLVRLKLELIVNLVKRESRERTD